MSITISANSGLGPSCPYDTGTPEATLWHDMMYRRRAAGDNNAEATKYEAKAAQWRREASVMLREADALEAAIAKLLNNV